MRARDIVGKKVAAVRQIRCTRDETHGGGSVWLFESIVFEDGTRFYVYIEEGLYEPFVTGRVSKPTSGRPGVGTA